MCACYAVRGSLYNERTPLDTVYGAILSAPCKLNSSVTQEFVILERANKILKISNVLNFII